jgi:uncharacterized membrane protein
MKYILVILLMIPIGLLIGYFLEKFEEGGDA